MFRIVVYKSTVAGFRFLLATDKDPCVLRSLPFSDMAACMAGVEAFRANLESDSCFEVWRTHRGDCFFNYFGQDGSILATSNVHDSIETLMDVMNAIRVHARNAPCVHHGPRKHPAQVAA